MNPTNTILSVFLAFAFHSTAQVTIRVLNQTDSIGIVDVACTNIQTNGISFTDEKGRLGLKSSTPYVLVHPSFYSLKIINIQNDTVVYLQPLVREIEEVEIVSTTNENLFKSVIEQYRSDLANRNRTGTLQYKNTNWFLYNYLEEQKTDSAYCSIENTLSFNVENTRRKSNVQFSPIDLNRYCSSFSFPKNVSIEVAKFPAFSRFDFTHFLNALFTQGSYFDKIGFDHTQSTKRVDEMNQTIELKFLSDECEKILTFSSVDSSLISYQFRSSSRLGGYHVYFATFLNQQVQSLYEEKGLVFDYDQQNHFFYSIHYGNFETNETIPSGDFKSFSDIMSPQSSESSQFVIEPLQTLYEYYLNSKN